MNIHPDGLAPEQLQTSFRDESRVIQRSVLSRIWTKKNTRPPILQDQCYGNCCLFSSICPDTGCTVYYVCDKTNTEQVNVHLQQICAKLREGHALTVLDKASWHAAKKLKAHDNFGLLDLAPYSPQLNSAENLFQYV